MTAWNDLIRRYANGQQICNCGEAYYSPCGAGAVMENGRWVSKTDMPACKHGCSANRLDAKDYVARCVLNEIGKEAVQP